MKRLAVCFLLILAFATLASIWDAHFCCVAFTKEAIMRVAAINLRLEPEQRDLIHRAAHLLGTNGSDFMLEAACTKATDVVISQALFSLDADRFKQFTKLLDAPIGHNPGLARLLKVRHLGRPKLAKHEFAIEGPRTIGNGSSAN